MNEVNTVERPVGQQPEPEHTCEQGCNGCDECNDHEDDDTKCPRHQHSHQYQEGLIIKFPAKLWLLTNSNESLFTLSPDDLAIFTLLTKEFYATDTQPGTAGSTSAN
jgi:hypothetical protein